MLFDILSRVPWTFVLYGALGLTLIDWLLLGQRLRTARTSPALAQASLDDVRELRRQLELLQSLGPMLGMLGTVVGIILAFDQLLAGGALSDVLAGIFLQLETTGIGLFVAVLAYLALHCHGAAAPDRPAPAPRGDGSVQQQERT